MCLAHGAESSIWIVLPMFSPLRWCWIVYLDCSTNVLSVKMVLYRLFALWFSPERTFGFFKSQILAFMLVLGICVVQTHLFLSLVCLLYSIKIIIFKNWMHSFEVSLGYESVDQSTFSMKRGSASCWKCSSINAFIPQWNFKRMHSILIIIFKSHQNLI